MNKQSEELAWEFNALLRAAYNNYMNDYPLLPQKMTFSQKEQTIFDNFRAALEKLPKDFLRDAQLLEILKNADGLDWKNKLIFPGKVDEVCDFLLR
jgi:hypothetical protein